MAYRKIQPTQIQGNLFDRLGNEWALVTAGTTEHCNTMTVSWGTFGVMWGKNVVQVVLRPQRYTKEFVDAQKEFTLSFYDAEHKKALGYLGKVSGREENKIEKVGFVPKDFDGVPAFEQANLVLVCKTLYTQTIDPAGFMPDTDCDEKWYPQKDYHVVYTAEIQAVYEKEE